MINLLGARIGKLTVKCSTDKRVSGYIVWMCVCDCGKEVEVASRLLISGKERDLSCGCSDTIRKTPVVSEALLERRLKMRERRRRIVDKIYSGKTIREIAREEGVSYQRISMIFHAEEGEDALTPRMEKSKYFWDEDKKALLGTVSDIELANTLGTSVYVVSSKRKRMGIKGYTRCKHSKPRYDRIGEKHGWLTVVEWVRGEGEFDRGFLYICECKCGKRTQPLHYNNFKKTLSCGCISRNRLIWISDPVKWNKMREEILSGRGEPCLA